MSSACSFIFMQIRVIFIRMVSHLDSLWNRGTRELGNGLLSPYHVTGLWKRSIYNHFQNEDCIIRNVDRSTKIFCNRTWILKIIYIGNLAQKKRVCHRNIFENQSNEWSKWILPDDPSQKSEKTWVKNLSFKRLKLFKPNVKLTVWVRNFLAGFSASEK